MYIIGATSADCVQARTARQARNAGVTTMLLRGVGEVLACTTADAAVSRELDALASSITGATCSANAGYRVRIRAGDPVPMSMQWPLSVTVSAM